MEFSKLTVLHHSEVKDEERRITLSPTSINIVAAAIEDTLVNGRSVRAVTVLFSDGGSVDLVVNHQDLEALETAVGAYCFG